MLTSAEAEVMDELYFLIKYDLLQDQLQMDGKTLNLALKNLLEKQFADQLEFNTQRKDFEKREQHDLEHLEQYHYLATKKGLLTHNR